MKNRLEVARELLRDDALIIVQCDDNEQAYLKVLMDEIFGSENFVGDLIRKTKSTTNNANTGFNIQHDNTLIFAKKKAYVHLVGKRKNFDKYTNPDNDPNGAWVSDNPSVPSGTHSFPIKNPFTGKVDYPPVNRGWLFSETKLRDHIKSGKIKFRDNHDENQRGFILKRYKSDIKSEFNLLGSLEGAENRYMNQVAAKERNKLFGKIKFDYPKPEEFLLLLIEATTKLGDIVLDYHLGSGTTCAVAHKTGRQYIGIEQMDYIEDIVVQRLSMVIKGEENEVGVSKIVNWKSGGNFVYTELAENSQKIVAKLPAKNDKDCIELWNSLKTNPYVSYHADFQKVSLDEFEQLSLGDKKKILWNLLDKNMLYVPYDEIDDDEFSISEKDKSLNRLFYSE